MGVTPWLPTDELEADLREPVIEAEQAGLDVLVPVVESEGYDAGLAKTAAMAAAVAVLLSDRKIKQVWARTMDTAAKDADEHWRREAKRAAILDRLNDPSLSELDRLRWLRENEKRFVRLRDRVKAETETDMKVARDRGVRPETYAKILREHGLPTHNGLMRGRAVVIASDQLWSLAGLIAKTQQLDAGIGRFTWRTMGDARVRDSHAALAGKVFAWTKPPSIGLPGEGINCRCWGEPVIPASE